MRCRATRSASGGMHVSSLKLYCVNTTDSAQNTRECGALCEWCWSCNPTNRFRNESRCHSDWITTFKKQLFAPAWFANPLSGTVVITLIFEKKKKKKKKKKAWLV